MSALTHEQARDYLLDRGSLHADEAAALDAHLAGCAECRTYARQTEAVRTATVQVLNRRWRNRQPPRDFDDRLLHRLRNTSMGQPNFNFKALASVGIAALVVVAFAIAAQSISNSPAGLIAATPTPIPPTATTVPPTDTAVPATATDWAMAPASTATDWPMGSDPTASTPALSVPAITPWTEALSSQPYVSATRAEPVYVRSGPGLAYAEWAILAPGHKFAVIGQANGWWQIESTTPDAWVNNPDITFSGDWNAVPVIKVPTLPPPPGASPTP